VAVVRDVLGVAQEGQRIDRVSLDNHVIRLKAITYGATLTSLLVPDGEGRREDVVLGYDSLAEYQLLRPGDRFRSQTTWSFGRC
jgi:aldose 1-epimerase